MSTEDTRRAPSPEHNPKPQASPEATTTSTPLDLYEQGLRAGYDLGVRTASSKCVRSPAAPDSNGEADTREDDEPDDDSK